MIKSYPTKSPLKSGNALDKKATTPLRGGDLFYYSLCSTNTNNVFPRKTEWAWNAQSEIGGLPMIGKNLSLLGHVMFGHHIFTSDFYRDRNRWN